MDAEWGLSVMQANEAQVAIGSHLTALRQAKKLSIGETASMTGLSANTIRWIERGVTQPKPESLRALASALGVQYQDLLVRAGYLERSDSSNEEREVLMRFKALSPKAKAALLELMPLMEQALEAQMADAGG